MVCTQCGLMLPAGSPLALCPHHHTVYGDDWAKGNRIMCDFVHRGIVPNRLTSAERDDDFWAAEGV